MFKMNWNYGSIGNVFFRNLILFYITYKKLYNEINIYEKVFEIGFKILFIININ